MVGYLSASMDALLYLFFVLFKAIAFFVLCLIGGTLEWLIKLWQLLTSMDHAKSGEWVEASADGLDLPGAYSAAITIPLTPITAPLAPVTTPISIVSTETIAKPAPRPKRKRLAAKPPPRPDFPQPPAQRASVRDVRSLIYSLAHTVLF